MIGHQKSLAEFVLGFRGTIEFGVDHSLVVKPPSWQRTGLTKIFGMFSRRLKTLLPFPLVKVGQLSRRLIRPDDLVRSRLAHSKLKSGF